MGLKVFTTGGDYPDQYNITREDGREFNESGDYLRFSGYFGEHGPHVFAAAPELLEALELVVKRCGPNSSDGKIARAAIAKAKGDVA